MTAYYSKKLEMYIEEDYKCKIIDLSEIKLFTQIFISKKLEFFP